MIFHLCNIYSTYYQLQLALIFLGESEWRYLNFKYCITVQGYIFYKGSKNKNKGIIYDYSLFYVIYCLMDFIP